MWPHGDLRYRFYDCISSGLSYLLQVGRSRSDAWLRRQHWQLCLWVPPFGPAPVDFMRHEAAIPEKPDFQGGVDSTFQKPPSLCFLLAEIWEADKNLAKKLF